MDAKIEALLEVATSIIKLAETLKAEQGADEKSTETKTTKKTTKKDNVVPFKGKEADPEEDKVEGTLDREELDAMTYNDLKKLAKSMGLTATGARAELTDKILSTPVQADSDDDDEPEEEKPAKNKKESKKTSKKTEAPKKSNKVEPEEEPDDEEGDDDEDDEDDIVSKVNESVKDMTDEEIKDILADCGVRAKGKRQALIAAVVDAVKDGSISLDDDDEDEDEDGNSDAGEAGEFDIDLEDKDLTDDRKEALEAYIEESKEEFESGDVKRKDMIEWLNSYHGTKEKMKDKSDEELFSEYLYFSSLLIDDDGEIVEEGPYTVNGEYFCCGHKLKYSKKAKAHICEVCGEKYED